MAGKPDRYKPVLSERDTEALDIAGFRTTQDEYSADRFRAIESDAMARRRGMRLDYDPMTQEPFGKSEKGGGFPPALRKFLRQERRRSIRREMKRGGFVSASASGGAVPPYRAHPKYQKAKEKIARLSKKYYKGKGLIGDIQKIVELRRKLKKLKRGGGAPAVSPVEDRQTLDVIPAGAGCATDQEGGMVIPAAVAGVAGSLGKAAGMAAAATIGSVVIGAIARPIARLLEKKIDKELEKKRSGGGFKYVLRPRKGQKLTDVGIWQGAFEQARRSLATRYKGPPKVVKRTIKQASDELKKKLLGSVAMTKGIPVAGRGFVTVADVSRPILLNILRKAGKRRLVLSPDRLRRAGAGRLAESPAAGLSAVPEDLQKDFKFLVKHLEDEPVMSLPCEHVLVRGEGIGEFLERIGRLARKGQKSEFVKFAKMAIIPGLLALGTVLMGIYIAKEEQKKMSEKESEIDSPEAEETELSPVAQSEGSAFGQAVATLMNRSGESPTVSGPKDLNPKGSEAGEAKKKEAQP